jgi:ATP-dependent RNA helicase DDX41
MGKTLVFMLPALIFALEEEMKMPVVSGEGPVVLVLLPSRELAI